MNYNININQKAIAELNEVLKTPLDLKDATILEWMLKFHAEPKSKKLLLGNNVYFWGAYQLIINENPLLNIDNKQTLSRKIDKLLEAGLLLKYINKDKGNKTYFSITQKCFDLIKRDSSTLLTKKSIAIDLKVDTLLTKKSNNNNIIDNISTTKENKFISTYLLKNKYLIETISMQHKNINVEDKIIEFENYCISIHKIHDNNTELYKHFMSWIRQNDFNKNKNVDKELGWFIDRFNSISRRNFQITNVVKTLFINQLNNGFTGEQMLKAIKNLYSRSDKNDFNKKTNYQHATPEFLLKNDNLNKYLNAIY